MKKSLFIFITLILFGTRLFSQDTRDSRIPLIGDNAPSFTAETTRGTITFPDDYYGKWKILFSHPADFTPVCTTELMELARLQDKLEKMDTKVIVISSDGLNSHLSWVKDMETIKYRSDDDPVKINFPLISDNTLEISKKYGMIHPNASTTRTIRGVFIIDPTDKIRAMFFYPFMVGRNMEEIMRTLTALQMSDDKNVLIPANWIPGGDVLMHSPKTQADAEKLAAKNDPTLREITWYLWFKKMK